MVGQFVEPGVLIVAGDFLHLGFKPGTGIVVPAVHLLVDLYVLADSIRDLRLCFFLLIFLGSF